MDSAIWNCCLAQSIHVRTHSKNVVTVMKQQDLVNSPHLAAVSETPWPPPPLAVFFPSSFLHRSSVPLSSSAAAGAKAQ